MSRVERFEDLQAWQKARVLTNSIYGITQGGSFAHDFGLRDQIRRSSVSVMSNIAEGFERSGDKEFVYFLRIAKGSVGEVKAQLYVALDACFITQEEFDELYVLSTEISRMIGGLIKYLKSQEK